MTRHSQNRTASPHFSHAERQLLAGSSKRAKIGSEAFRAFNACGLCLDIARDPKVCQKGHVFCNECIISNLVRQKQDIKRQQALVEKMRADEAAERELAREKARERVLENFERAQQSGAARPVGAGALASTSGAVRAPAGVSGVKRKFAGIDAADVDQAVRDAEDAALRQLEDEQKLSRTAKLSSFWLPSLTPEAAPTRLDDVKLQTMCQAGKPHALALKHLADADFCPGATADAPPTCWACRRTLTNNGKVVVPRPCGHALCGECATLGERAKSCPKCDAPTEPKNFVALTREGTGFASGGQVEIKTRDVAFHA